MYCSRCGKPNSNDAQVCVSCGHAWTVPPSPAGPSRSETSTWLVASILATVLCCLPFGIPAIVYAVRSQSQAQLGDVEAAAESLRKAKIWTVASVLGMLIPVLIYCGFMFIAILIGALGKT